MRRLEDLGRQESIESGKERDNLRRKDEKGFEQSAGVGVEDIKGNSAVDQSFPEKVEEKVVETKEMIGLRDQVKIRSGGKNLGQRSEGMRKSEGRRDGRKSAGIRDDRKSEEVRGDHKSAALMRERRKSGEIKDNQTSRGARENPRSEENRDVRRAAGMKYERTSGKWILKPSRAVPGQDKENTLVRVTKSKGVEGRLEKDTAAWRRSVQPSFSIESKQSRLKRIDWGKAKPLKNRDINKA